MEPKKPPFLIAEIGCNHKGDMSIAREMIDVAAMFCKVPAVKFQKRTTREVLTPEEYDRPHPNPRNSYGATYGEHREFLEFTIDQHLELRDYCQSKGIVYSTSVWDMTSTKEIVALSPQFLKIPSACNTHFDMAAYICDNFAGEIQVSLGMTTAAEIDGIVSFYAERGRAKDLVIYHCTSAYPVPFRDTHLLEVSRLVEKYGKTVKTIGFSGHHLGIAIDIAALTLGATCIERHFTLDRTWKGTDHAASLEPDGMRKLWRDLKATHECLTAKGRDILPIEEEARKKLKWDRNA